MNKIQDLKELREALGGEPHPLSSKKIYNHLNPQMQAFIAQSPLLMLSTVDADGFPTISPKGDDAGFVYVEDNNTLLIPERKGNKLAFSLQNILDNGKVALLFSVPGVNETLRVHGECTLIHDHALCEQLASQTHDALLIMRVEVKDAYFHCAKAYLRSKTWQPESQSSSLKVSFGKEIAGNINENQTFEKQVDNLVAENDKTEL
ncbi:pyridoxamine 5'-phosphate oxidase family protein [Maricurvus nonylphenolicus]|uniref:MSMEG_1061 family FMN-dependent PPOX-type flavoprotein n=1 Tax=Maricurvus nonylphenolicus TaxID=1008307 RepID=UPI0036F1F02A